MRAPRDLAIRGISKGFDVRGAWLSVLEDIDLACPASSLTALIGPSGCGKSTILRIAMSLERPDSGEVTIGASAFPRVQCWSIRSFFSDRRYPQMPHLPPLTDPYTGKEIARQRVLDL